MANVFQQKSEIQTFESKANSCIIYFFVGIFLGYVIALERIHKCIWVLLPGNQPVHTNIPFYESASCVKDARKIFWFFTQVMAVWFLFFEPDAIGLKPYKTRKGKVKGADIALSISRQNIHPITRRGFLLLNQKRGVQGSLPGWHLRVSF